MHPLGKFLIATAMLAGSVGLTATPASAADGQLTITDWPAGQSSTYIDPAPGCYRTIKFNTITNNTDGAVTVYTDENCRLDPKLVQPGTGTVSVGTRFSVAIP